MLGQLFSEFIEIVKAHVPDFSFGYLERLVPILDIRNGVLYTTDKRATVFYEILPRAVVSLDAGELEVLFEKLSAYGRDRYEVSFFCTVSRGLPEDYEKHVSLFRGKGLFEVEAEKRKNLFDGGRKRRYFVSFSSPSVERLLKLEMSSFPFVVKGRLDDNGIFNMFRCFLRDCGNYDFRKVLLSNLKSDGYASVRESIFPAEIELLDDCLKVGKHYCLPFSVESIGTPSPDVVYEILEIPDEAFFTTSFRYLSKIEAEELISNKLKAVKGLGFSTTAKFQKHALEELLSIVKLSDYSDPLCYFQMGCVLFSESRDELKETAERVRSHLKSYGYSVYLEGDLVRELADNLVPKARRLGFFNDAVLSTPSYTRFVGYETPALVFLDRNDRDLIYFDPLDRKSQSWGICIFGPAGSGKSNLANAILKTCRALGAWIVVIDIGDSYRELCSFFDGEYVRVSLSGETRINPFQFRFGFTKVPEERVEFLVPFFETLLRYEFDPEEVSLLKRYVSFLYQEKLSRDDNENWQAYLELIRKPFSKEVERRAYEHFCRAMPTISDMLLEFEYLDAFRQRLEPKEAELLDRLKVIFRGLENHPLFDGPTTVRLTEDFTVFELKELSGEEYRHYLESFYMLLQRFINEEVYYSEPDPAKVPKSLIDFYGEEELTKRWRRFKVFLTDEFHFVRNSKPIMEDTGFMYATGRKKNLVRIIVSQFLTDLLSQGEDVYQRIVDNTAVIFLASHRRESPTGDLIRGYEDAIRKTAERLLFSEKELEMFRSLKRGRDFADYFMVSRDKGRTPVRYRNSELERWLYATYTEDVVLRDTLIRKFGREKAYELLLTKPVEELKKLAGVSDEI